MNSTSKNRFCRDFVTSAGGRNAFLACASATAAGAASKKTAARHAWPISVSMGRTALGVMVATVALTGMPGTAQAGDMAKLSLSATEARPGDTISVSGSEFRVGTEASFIYTLTVLIGGVLIEGVASVDASTAYLHGGRTTDSGLYIAEHIDIDPADTTADGAFTAEFVLPQDLAAGEHELHITSCWGGPEDAYPEDGVAPCGTKGLGGGVNDRVATAHITIMEQ